MVSVGVVVLQVVERMVVPDPGFDHYTLVPLCGGHQEFLDTRRDLLVDQVIQVPEVVKGVR